MNLLIIAPNDYEALEKKGVLYQYENYKEDEYFTSIISLFPFNRKNMTVFKENNILFYQYGWLSRFPKINTLKVTKILGSVVILFKLMFIFPFVIKKYNIKIIRATDPYLMGVLGLFYSKIFNIPLAISVHSDYALCNEVGGQTFKLLGSRKLAKRLEKYVYASCDKILPISKYLINNIMFDYPSLSPKKFERFPHGINRLEFDDCVNIDIREHFSITSETKIICYIARLSKEKNCLDIPFIIESLSKSIDNFKVLIIGDGDESSNLINKLEVLGLSKHVLMVGFQSKEIVFNARKQADVNICLLDGFSLIEAGLSEKPLVAYDTEWHKELVIDEETGFLVRVGAYETFASKIYMFLTNDEMAKEYAKNLRALTIQNHELKNTQVIKQGIYAKILDAKVKND